MAKLHSSKSTPALAVTELFMMVISSASEQIPLVTVHKNVFSPDCRLFTVDVAREVLVMFAGEVVVHVPEPFLVVA